MTLWSLPQTATIGGVEYPLNTDYRDVLEIIQNLNNAENPEWLRWQIAIALFFEGEIPEEHQLEAMEYLLALLDHGIDGNNIEQMQHAKEELQNHLINR